jgi:hypothetical protein
VHLLPFLGQEKLYKRFHLNEPWDSENNAALISKMPDVYDFDPDSRNADVGACLGKTCYLALTGVGTLVSASDATGALPTEQMKGEQIIVVETDEARATIWTKPDDATVAQLSSKATSGVLGRRKGKVLSLLANGWIVLVAPENLGDKVAGKKATVVLKKVIEEPEDSHPNR